MGPRKTGRGSIVLALLVTTSTAAGCSLVGNTPAQELSWERWRACDRFATIGLDRIDTDGRLVVKGQELEAAPFTACVRAVAADQARRGVATSPDAVVLVKLYGRIGGPN